MANFVSFLIQGPLTLLICIHQILLFDVISHPFPLQLEISLCFYMFEIEGSNTFLQFFKLRLFVDLDMHCSNS